MRRKVVPPFGDTTFYRLLPILNIGNKQRIQLITEYKYFEIKISTATGNIDAEISTLVLPVVITTLIFITVV